MLLIKVNARKPRPADISRVVSALKAGQVIVLPTETVYTLAVDATNAKAVKRVFKIKGRDFNKPLHVVVSSLTQADEYVKVNTLARKLANTFLPGPLTLILPKKSDKTPDNLAAGFSTLGIRIPGLPLNALIAREFGKPYTTTSANISGGHNPYTVGEVLSQIPKERIDLAVDVGELPHLAPSTLIDLTYSPPKILRKGPVTKEQIESVLGQKLDADV